MTATIIDGKAIAAGLVQRVATAAARLTATLGRPLGLAVVLVGEDPASRVYVRNKARQTIAAGMRSIEHRLAADASPGELLDLVAALNADDTVDGILVQLPLPPQHDAQRIIAAIDPAKDVDGFHPLNAGYLASGLPGLVPSPTLA